MSAGALRVSVVIPVFNAARHLTEAIESVLAQRLAPLEIVVIDDGSTDRSGAIARGFAPHVRCITQPNAGAAAAKNAGIRGSHGEAIAFLDSDDIWMPEKLALQVPVLREHPGTEAVSGHVRQFVSDEVAPSLMARIRCDAKPVPGHLTSALLIRRDAFQRVGWFAEERRINDFAEWWLRAAGAGLQVAMLPDVVVRRRLHANNMGRTVEGSNRDLLRLVKASIDRRRAPVATPPDGGGDGVTG